MMSTGDARSGRIYTFYSYKGGVGRSLALANTAALLARNGRRVLVVDWDLEAPGIERYFEDAVPGISDKVRGKPGVVDIASEMAHGNTFDWRDCVIPVSIPAAPEPFHLITAGDRTGDYVGRLQRLDWDRLFLRQNFGLFLESTRDEWRLAYDFVLIDSRTGLTDIGGICTIYLPDGLVAFFTANEQSVQGTAEILLRARKARSALPTDRGTLTVLPVAARDEGRNEYQQSLDWRQKYVKSFGRFYEEFLPRTVSPADAFEILRIPNVPYWSFGERLPVLAESAADPSTLTFYYAMLAQLLATDFSWPDSVPTSIADETDSAERRLHFADARGVQVGDSNTQVNYYGPQRPTLDDYRRQFEQVAPEYLSGRHAELAALDGFCSGDAGTLWVRGRPWSGKTALLTWFMVHRPAGIDVVGFLVSRRLAGQSSSDAFVDALIDQLSSLIGGQRVEARMPFEKAALLHSLLRAAADETSRQDRRLVLVVDGLDEDSGPESVPKLSSIASLLPASFNPSRIKVLVSSRESYELPEDVPQGHPLRGAQKFELSPSAAADEVAGLARGELRDLLLHDPTVQQLIGLVTVADGELLPADLTDLTGLPPFQVAEYLSGSFGRALTRHDGRLLFAHAALREEAKISLGPRLIRQYRRLFEAWLAARPPDWETFDSRE